MKEKYFAAILIALVIVPSALAVTLGVHTNKVQFVLQYGNNPHCIIVDSHNGYIYNNTAVTLLGVSPVANTTDTIVLGLKNVSTTPINITSIQANSTDTNIKLTVQSSAPLPFAVTPNTTFPFNIMATIINTPTTLTSQPINVFASCN